MMNRMKIRPLAVVAVLLVAAAGIQETARAQGESAVPFLLIAPNSRASGVGESGTGWIDDASAIFWNPAQLAFLQGHEVSLTHANWLPQFQLPDLFYDYLVYRQDIPEIGGTIGASVTYLNLGEFVVTNSSGPQEQGRFKSFEYAVTAGYATRVVDDLGLGMNLKFIHSALSPIGTEQEQGKGVASTVAVDLALMWRPTSLDIPLIGDLGNIFSLGVNLQNLGPKVTYVDAAQADPLPTNLRLGLGFRVLNDEFNQMTLGLDMSRLLVKRNGKDEPPDGLPESLITSWSDGGLKKVIYALGAEYWYGAPKLIALRIGYFNENAEYGNRKFMTFGAGIRYSLYGFDFSYISASEGHPLSDTIRFTLLIGWGGND
jgi:hypothetical protein